VHAQASCLELMRKPLGGTMEVTAWPVSIASLPRSRDRTEILRATQIGRRIEYRFREVRIEWSFGLEKSFGGPTAGR